MADFILKVDTAVEVFVNIAPLIDDTDFKTRETAVAYNAAGMDLVWNFQTPTGVVTQTAVTPTTSGSYDWTHVGDGIYKIEIPASGGASINNDTEGFGWFSGVVTGVLPWRGPVIQFSPANVVDALVLGSDKLEVDVAQYGGTNGTFSGGRPEVNTTHAAGTAWASGAITAASIAADAITAAKLASDVTTELQSGLATAASLATVEGKIDTVDTVVDAILVDTAEIGAAGAGLTALATQSSVNTIDDFLDTEIAAIKAKTDNLPASPAATGDIPTAIENADALLNRDMSAVSDTNARTPLNALRVLRNKIDTTGGTLTVNKEDDTTAAWTAALTTDASADPVTAVDPT